MNQHIAPFIALEGMDGSGKTTLLRGLQKALDPRYFLFTREPGGTPTGEVIRDVLLDENLSGNATGETQLLGFFYARSHHVGPIADWRKTRTVVTDRFDGSTYGYQVVAQSKSDQAREELSDKFWTLRDMFLLSDQRVPTLYLYLDLPPEIAYARRKSDTGQEKNHYDTEPLTFYEKQHEGYLEFFREIVRQADSEVIFLEAALPPEKLLAEALTHILNHTLYTLSQAS